MNDSQFNSLKITGVTVTWEIENIWNLSFDGVSSASFVLSDHIFHLFVRRYELSIAVYLCRDDIIPTVLSLLCKLCMIDHIGQEKPIGEKEIFIEKGKEFVLIESINIKDLESQKDEFLINDTLVIRCNVSACYKRNLLKNADVKAETSIKCFQALSSDFESLFVSHKSADILLKVEDTEFPVHRTVLCARSPAIASTLDQEALEAPVNIENIQQSTFRDVLYYIYTGKVRGLTSDTAVPMLTAADRFSLSELKNVCLTFLLSNLSDNNIFDVAALAYESGDLVLKQEVEQFIVRNLSTILQSDKWKNFCTEKYKHANEILTFVLLRMQKNTGENHES